jgi:hypothetical protein
VLRARHDSFDCLRGRANRRPGALTRAVVAPVQTTAEHLRPLLLHARVSFPVVCDFRPPFSATVARTPFSGYRVLFVDKCCAERSRVHPRPLPPRSLAENIVFASKVMGDSTRKRQLSKQSRLRWLTVVFVIVFTCYVSFWSTYASSSAFCFAIIHNHLKPIEIIVLGKIRE